MLEVGSLLISAWHKIGAESKALEKQNILEDDMGIDEENIQEGKGFVEQENSNTHDQIRNCVE